MEQNGTHAGEEELILALAPARPCGRPPSKPASGNEPPTAGWRTPIFDGP
ncbi:MAG TPA: hypothetical protein VG125_03770 [Pirellulales bacterium]|nr:hypothetical protein [Pirellulales bacterium]